MVEVNYEYVASRIARLALHSSQPAGLRIGDPLPALRGEFLSGRPAALPHDAAGRIALLLLGFTYESRFAVEAWAERFRHQFQADPRVTFYEIPLIGGLSRLGKWFVDSGMRRGTPKQDYEHVITVYRYTEEWKPRVGFDNPNAAYLILLDRDGRIAWRHAGVWDEQASTALAAKVTELVGTD